MGVLLQAKGFHGDILVSLPFTAYHWATFIVAILGRLYFKKQVFIFTPFILIIINNQILEMVESSYYLQSLNQTISWTPIREVISAAICSLKLLS